MRLGLTHLHESSPGVRASGGAVDLVHLGSVPRPLSAERRTTQAGASLPIPALALGQYLDELNPMCRTA